jgi:hypothetical protein
MELKEQTNYCHILNYVIKICTVMLHLSYGDLLHMWFVPKVSVLIFYLNVYLTHLKLQVISFKV